MIFKALSKFRIVRGICLMYVQLFRRDFNGIKEKLRFKVTNVAQSMPHARGRTLDLAKDGQQSPAFYMFLSYLFV